MASFFHKKLEDISIAQKIGELRPDPSEAGLKELLDFKTTRGLCWHVVFSPDESHFAWIASQRKVILVPWNRDKNRLYKSTLPNSGPPEPNASASASSFSASAVEETRPYITIDCCYPVQSLAFGSGIPTKALLYDHDSASFLQDHEMSKADEPKSYWTRFDFKRDIILATGHTNGRICIWCVKTGKLLLELMDHKSAVRDLSFAPDGSLRLISASLDKTLKGWDLKDDGNMFNTFIAHRDAVMWCCWSPNARLMASSGSDKAVYLWNMNSYKLFQTLNGHVHEVVSCTFSPDGAILATASWDSQVILWDPYLGKILYKLYHLHPPPNMIYASGANNAWVRCVSFAKDGLNLVTVSDDHLIRFWNLLGDVDPQVIALEDEQSLSCAYSPTGRCVAVGTAQFKISFYSTVRIEVPKLLHFARLAVRTQLSTPEVDALDIPYSLKAYLKYEAWDSSTSSS